MQSHLNSPGYIRLGLRTEGTQIQTQTDNQTGTVAFAVMPTLSSIMHYMIAIRIF